MAVRAVVGGVAMLDKFKAYGFRALALVLGALLLSQTWRLHTEQLAHEKLKTATSEAKTTRATTALTAERETSASESTHAQHTQEASDAYTTSQPVRDALHRADLARVERLRLGAERRAATYRAQATANAAACSRAADRLEAFDRHIVEGVEVVGELRAVVDRRDAEVVLLRGQIDADRALLAPATTH